MMRRPAMKASPKASTDRKSTRLNSSHGYISYAVVCLKKKQIIAQDVEAHLGSDLVEGQGQEVGGAHPGLQCPARVFAGLALHTHAVRHAIEPIQQPFQ